MLTTVLRTAMDLALPPRCPGCGSPCARDGAFCADCWGAMRFIGPPWCERCRLPFDYETGPGACCDACLVRPPRHVGVSAAVAYGPIARQLALKLKYGRRIGLADTMAALMVRHVPAGSELVVPVPLHRWRLWRRGYNQAALLARAVARRAGLPVRVDALVRIQRTPVLRGLSGRERARAVWGAFAATPGAAIAGRRLLLVDDVYTSGATVAACTRALRDAGAAEVAVLCWARVLAGSD